MPTSTNTIWVDSTFDGGDLGEVGLTVEYELIVPDGIGNFSDSDDDNDDHQNDLDVLNDAIDKLKESIEKHIKTQPKHV